MRGKSRKHTSTPQSELARGQGCAGWHYTLGRIEFVATLAVFLPTKNAGVKFDAGAKRPAVPEDE